MRKILVLASMLAFVVSSAAGQAWSQSAAVRADTLSLEQTTKISQLITKQTPPLAASSFSIAVDSVVPAEIEVHPLPAEAERLAPELRGFGYVVIEELVALVDPQTRKVEIVFPRWAP
jgi:uncharacterized protein DUF1236